MRVFFELSDFFFIFNLILSEVGESASFLNSDSIGVKCKLNSGALVILPLRFFLEFMDIGLNG